MNDEDLMLLVQTCRDDNNKLRENARVALTELRGRYFHQAVAFLIRKYRLRDDVAEDLVQDVFVRLAQTQTFAPARGTFSPWFYKIVARMALDHLRATTGYEFTNFDLADADRVAAEQSAMQEDVEELSRCLEELDLSQRELIGWILINGESQTSVAKRTNRSLTVIHTQYHAALRLLREFWERRRDRP